MPSHFYMPYTLDKLSSGVKSFLVETLPEEGVENISPEYLERKILVTPEKKRKNCKTDLILQFVKLQERPLDPLQILLQDEEAGFSIWGH